MMKKLLFTLSFGLLSMGASAQYLCSYQAHLSDNDKYSSSGVYLAKNYTQASAAAVIRQDRANFHKFHIRDYYDQGDCVFNHAKNRDKLERWLAKGRIAPYAIRQIIDGNPIINVDVFSDYIQINVR